MQTAKTSPPRHQARAPSVETPVSPAIPGKRRGWHQRLRQWGTGAPLTGRRPAVPQRLYDLWDAQHEQVWTPTVDSYWDFIIKETRPALRIALYQHMALS